MNGQEKKKQNKGGRSPKVNRAVHRYVFRLTDEENAKFLTLFEASGADNKAQFVTSVLFQKPIKSVKVDMAAMDYYTRLTALFAQFRAVGVNYNQVVKILYRNFSEKKAATYLFKLEKQTEEMAKLCREIMELTAEFEAKHLTKNVEK
ncbi:conjugal transfer protein MobA [Sphingobacterium sp.]|uniref:conjugal transfer protein MobA n=1 Tax=Sphingobacterium sp. TaxID=341027 RepID=UPI0028A1AC8D|nr:conjugal transfer protein MobA [Sphingobacterium sp.]